MYIHILGYICLHIYVIRLPGNIMELIWAMSVMFLSVYISSMILGTLVKINPEKSALLSIWIVNLVAS